jgi:hypothetical protein
MFTARWSIDIRFGHKDEALQMMKKWFDDVGAKVGFEKGSFRIHIGSIGVSESRFENDIMVPSLEALEKAWARMATLPAHQQFGKQLEPLIVSGSNKWEVYRVVDL